MIKVVSVKYFDNSWHREFTFKAVLIKETPKTMKLHFKNNHLFGRMSTLKKENIISVSELDNALAIDFCNSCHDLEHYTKQI